jgi:uncharacterized phage-associated protein
MSAAQAEIILKISTERLMRIAERVRLHYWDEFDRDYPDWVIVAALGRWLDGEMERVTEDLPAILTSPERPEARRFRTQLEQLAGPSGPYQETKDAFSGNRIFSFEKFSAMVAYIALNARNVYKTKLNKLLFYSDFVNYYSHGSSISGARYVHLPHGPVPDGYERTLRKLAAAGIVAVAREMDCEIINASDLELPAALSLSERASLDWVIDTYGDMSARSISELSHREKAYKHTRPGEPIAYEYAKFFERLPPGP